jgi:hypothetical protein
MTTVPHVSIPRITPDMRLLDAALAYASCGWCVLPVRRGDYKNPGSYVGKGWPSKSSCDEAVVKAWWSQWPDAGIALHVGKSGAVVIDGDTMDEWPLPWGLLDTAMIQNSRPDDPLHGHYVFSADGGDFGNSVAGFPRTSGARSVVAMPSSSRSRPRTRRQTRGTATSGRRTAS